MEAERGELSRNFRWHGGIARDRVSHFYSVVLWGSRRRGLGARKREWQVGTESDRFSLLDFRLEMRLPDDRKNHVSEN